MARARPMKRVCCCSCYPCLKGFRTSVGAVPLLGLVSPTVAVVSLRPAFVVVLFLLLPLPLSPPLLLRLVLRPVGLERRSTHRSLGLLLDGGRSFNGKLVVQPHRVTTRSYDVLLLWGLNCRRLYPTACCFCLASSSRRLVRQHTEARC